jgi:hypothetical protein
LRVERTDKVKDVDLSVPLSTLNSQLSTADDNDMLAEGPLLPEGAPYRCPFCGESYQFTTHPHCLKKALLERNEARAVARRLYHLGTWSRVQHVFHEEYPWLKESDGKP